MLEFKQTGHLDPALVDPAVAKNVEKLLGRWANTNRETRGIAECEIRRDGDQFGIQIFGAGENGPIEWPRARTKAPKRLPARVRSIFRRVAIRGKMAPSRAITMPNTNIPA
jgi:hypothetical protein